MSFDLIPFVLLWLTVTMGCVLIIAVPAAWRDREYLFSILLASMFVPVFGLALQILTMIFG